MSKTACFFSLTDDSSLKQEEYLLLLASFENSLRTRNYVVFDLKSAVLRYNITVKLWLIK